MHLPKNKTKKWLKKSFSIQFNLTEPIRESSRSGHYSQHDYHQQNGQEESNHNNADGHHHQDETETFVIVTQYISATIKHVNRFIDTTV